MATSRRPQSKADTAQPDALKVTFEPFGPTVDDVRAVAKALRTDRAVQAYLKKTRHRLLRIDTLRLDAAEKTKPARPAPPDRFRAVFFDYTNNRSVIATGPLKKPKALDVMESAVQPLPSPAEFAEAVRMVSRRPDVGSAVRERRMIPYRPMPPLVGEEQPDGRAERTIAVGLLPRGGLGGHEIVAANMVRRQVVRFDPGARGSAPRMAAAEAQICGLPVADQPTASGVPGSVWVTVTQGGAPIWKFLAVRPAASSGTNGSAIELRFVDYRGKRLLYRAHVPILNVKYDNDACGPYRDWQNEEGMIDATGADVAPGFRFCPARAKTILDTGTDTGNYLGVGVYVEGQEVVLVSEMQAGWYRYVSEWRLHADGTIRPRFGFSAVQNSCVCNVHHHHAYWRFDFDMRTPDQNRVLEFNDPPIGLFHWHEHKYEISRGRDPLRHRKWRVENKLTGEAYDIVPGLNDGVAATSTDAPFPRGDVWLLHYRATEIDDGVMAIGPPYEAGLDPWVNGERIHGEDVVVWYGAHFTHDVGHDEPGEFGHVVGPDLVRVKW